MIDQTNFGYKKLDFSQIVLLLLLSLFSEILYTLHY